ncbi:hypothetical protein [Lishizhenia sp.]|uniref:hypothetical protein n=1 Tax=Lishizhenia sp. TaxID=2497594 RepID=UPI00299F4C88|nr:hypothetical protein [Lishizhenia sp.]MDX1446074.1 hypothetical protein [Lishizhenia sp.]
MKLKQLIIPLTISSILFSCSSSRFIEPLAKKQNAVSADFGGPLVNVPGVATIPLPFSSLTYGRGLSHSTTIYGSWHTTAAVFGVAQFDLGVVKEVWYNRDRHMGISITPSVNFARDVFEQNTKLWPILEANYYWKYNQQGVVQADLLSNRKIKYNFVYAGVGSWFELSSTRAHDQPQNNWAFPMVQVGHTFRRNKWSFSTELKMMVPYMSNQDIVLDYKSITGERGATGIYIGVIKRF